MGWETVRASALSLRPSRPSKAVASALPREAALSSASMDALSSEDMSSRSRFLEGGEKDIYIYICIYIEKSGWGGC